MAVLLGLMGQGLHPHGRCEGLGWRQRAGGEPRGGQRVPAPAPARLAMN